MIKAALQNILRQESQVKAVIKNEFKLSGNKYIVEMKKGEGNMEVLKKMRNMKGNTLYIETKTTALQKKTYEKQKNRIER